MDNQDKLLELEKKMIERTIDFDKLPPIVKKSMFEYIAFRRELTKESDRGCALLAAAHLDFMLEELLRKKLLGNKKQFETLFGINGPLGSFSSRILLCYSLGLISAGALNDIQIIRKIRNEFGHSTAIIDFNNQKIKDLCNNLKFNVYENEVLPRRKFLNVVSGLSGQIESQIIISERFKEKKEPNYEKRKEDFEKMMAIIKKATKDENLEFT